MTEAKRIGLIRQCFTQGLCDVLDDVIHLARVKNKQPVTRTSRSRHGRHAATSTFSSGEVIPTLQGYIEALPVETQRKLTAFMIFGREPYGLSVHDIEAVCSTPGPNDKELPTYLATKVPLADYLERARNILGL